MVARNRDNSLMRMLSSKEFQKKSFLAPKLFILLDKDMKHVGQNKDIVQKDIFKYSGLYSKGFLKKFSSGNTCHFSKKSKKMKKKKNVKFNAQKLSSYEDIDSLVENENRFHSGNTVFLESSPKLTVVLKFPFNLSRSKLLKQNVADLRTLGRNQYNSQADLCKFYQITEMKNKNSSNEKKVLSDTSKSRKKKNKSICSCHCDVICGHNREACQNLSQKNSKVRKRNFYNFKKEI